MFGDDYEQPGSVKNSNNPAKSGFIKRKLVKSTWDLNDGTFIWKPHYDTIQKVALVNLVLVGVFVIVMTIFDVIIRQIPDIHKRFKLL